MRRAYGALVAVTLALALAIVSLARLPRRDAAPVPATPASPVVALALDLAGGSVVPAVSAVPKDHRVRLEVRNRGRTPARLALAGYEDRVSATIAAGETLRVEFLADRPGEDFPWLLDGSPAGRLSVTGSHLVEGHR